MHLALPVDYYGADSGIQMSDAFDPFDDSSRASSTVETGAAAAAADESTTTRDSLTFSSSFLNSDYSSADEQKKHYESKLPSQFGVTVSGTAFESDLFDFSTLSKSNPAAVSAGDAIDSFHDQDFLSESTVFPDLTTDRSGWIDPTTVHVALHEQLTTRYDGNDGIAVSHVEGSIHARSSCGSPFTLAIMDKNRHIETLQEDPSFCISRRTPDLYDSHVPTDICTLLTVALPPHTAKKQKIASYLCTSHVKPIPLLVKSKVVIEGGRCRVGIKIRSNPANRQSLKQIAILMAVPPDIRGETVKLTRQGGVWDGIKRVMAWPAESLSPGELIEIQAQFSFTDTSQGHEKRRPTFPILVRCEGTNDQFSDVRLTTDESDVIHAPVKMSLTRSVLILHRKV